MTYHDERGLKSKFVVSETSSYRSALQWVPDYEKAMKRGFIDIQNEAKAKLAGLDLTNSVDIWEKKPFLEAMIIVCDAIMIWAKRHAQLARDTAAATSDPVRKQELLRMADICERVPAYPARNFREAVQCSGSCRCSRASNRRPAPSFPTVAWTSTSILTTRRILKKAR